MTGRFPVLPVPGLLEDYPQQFNRPSSVMSPYITGAWARWGSAAKR
jgi:hypothetical protein